METTAKLVTKRIGEIVASYPSSRESLIPILQDVQAETGYLNPETVDEIAACTGISPNEIYGVATFYSFFRFTPPGKHRIVTCQGTACHVRGGHRILAEFEGRLGIKAGQTTTNGNFELQRVACIGCCALAPVVVVDDEVHAGMTDKKVRAIIDKHDAE
jgi:NADH-quinone oxidoreductase subunit E